MRIVTWNMGCGSPIHTGRYRKAHEEAWRLLLALNPDIVLAQEALLDSPGWLREEGQLVTQQRGYDKQDSGCVIFVRGGATATAHPLSFPTFYAVVADVTVRDERLLVASLHVDTNDQRKKLRALIDGLVPAVAGRRFIVGGDLNAARRWDEVYKKDTYGWFFAELAEQGIHDCHYGLHLREEQSFWGHQAKEAYQLDHLFVGVGDASRVTACKIVTSDDTRRLSDHSPMVLDLV